MNIYVRIKYKKKDLFLLIKLIEMKITENKRRKKSKKPVSCVAYAMFRIFFFYFYDTSNQTKVQMKVNFISIAKKTTSHRHLTMMDTLENCVDAFA